MISKEKLVCITTNQSNTLKNQLHNAIKTRDFDKVVELMEAHDIDPNEEISVKGYLWTPFHYASHFNDTRILEYLLKRGYFKNPNNFVKMINSQTKEGWTPLMICAIYRSIDCVELLLRVGGINTAATDNSGKTALQLAEYYGSIQCANKLRDIPLGILHLDESYFVQEKMPAYMEDPAYYDLLIGGVLRPCIYCESNLGYLRYSKCCGTPMHQQCLREKDFICWGCQTGGAEVYGEITDPTKAFTLNGN